MFAAIRNQIKALTESNEIAKEVIKSAKALYISGQCQLLSQSKEQFDFWISDEFTDEEMTIQVKVLEREEEVEEGEQYLIHAIQKAKVVDWDKYAMACLMQLSEELECELPAPFIEGKKYTREGMIKRVMQERWERAKNASYRIEYADNIYGEHILTNERGVKYRITLRDFENETGYVNNMDCRTNKLGTTKHIMYTFHDLKSNKRLYKRLKKRYPFVEIYLDPLNDYQISWFYPHDLKEEVAELIQQYFGTQNYIPHSDTTKFLSFLNKAHIHKEILIRPEVKEKVEKAFEQRMLVDISRKT